MAIEKNKKCVYRFKDEGGQTLYIGKSTLGIEQRMRQHFSQSSHLDLTGVYEETKKVEYVTFPNKIDIDIVERFLIEKHNPKYNKKSGEEKITLKINLDSKWKEFNFEHLKTHPKFKETVYHDKELGKTYTLEKEGIDNNQRFFYAISINGKYHSSKDGSVCSLINTELFQRLEVALERSKEHSNARVEKFSYKLEEQMALPSQFYSDLKEHKNNKQEELNN